MKKHNFSAGPAILPQPVLKEAAKAVIDYNGVGLSLLEMSHRGSEFTAIIEEAVALLKELIGLPAGYEGRPIQNGELVESASTCGRK